MKLIPLALLLLSIPAAAQIEDAAYSPYKQIDFNWTYTPNMPVCDKTLVSCYIGFTMSDTGTGHVLAGPSVIGPTVLSWAYFKVLGFVKDMTKSDAREAVGKVVAAENAKIRRTRTWRFGEFVDEVFTPYYSRKWKKSTKGTTVNRIQLHLVEAFRDRELSLLLRDELQDLLDRKVKNGLSFSIVDHLRWDLRQIFEMAVAEGFMERNPATLLFTPREARRPIHRLMTSQEIKRCVEVLDLRERIIVKLAVLAGLRPGEIFGLTWDRMSNDHVEIMQRVYRGTINTPKTNQSVRRAAILLVSPVILRSGGSLLQVRSSRLSSLPRNAKLHSRRKTSGVETFFPDCQRLGWNGPISK